jgi:ABC-2 type transport system permease protein
MTVQTVSQRLDANASAPIPATESVRPLSLGGYWACFSGIVWREVLRFLHQRERFLSALVRPLVWLFIFAAGFRQVLGVSIIPPYETYVLYEVFIAPGLIGMILLFNAMQSSLTMVYDRETGAMRTLLVSPFPRSFLLLSKLIGGVAVALLQSYAFLLIAYYWGVEPGGPEILRSFSMPLPLPWDSEFALRTPAIMMGHLTVLPALFLSGLMLGALALFVSSVIKQLENFAGVMNFVIFPMFFASSALYPLWRVKESSPLLYEICWLNPFTHAVELIRFAMYGQIDYRSLYAVLGFLVFFLGAAIYAYNPSKGLIGRRGGAGSSGA